MADMVVVPFEARAPRIYGPLRAAHRERNRDALYKLVTADARALNVTLVTNNESGFLCDDGLQVKN